MENNIKLKTGAWKHGETRRSKEYRAWCCMKTRCYNKKRTDYKNYGGRGIYVCMRWLKYYKSFLMDMGRSPKNCSLDRINNNDIYKPSNCRWANRDIQANNSRRANKIQFNGKSLSLTEWGKEIGMNRGSIIKRLKDGYSVEEALTMKKWSSLCSQVSA